MKSESKAVLVLRERRMRRTDEFCVGAADNKSRSIGDRDAQAFVGQVLGNGPDDCSGRLVEVTQSLRLCQHWLRQSV